MLVRHCTIVSAGTSPRRHGVVLSTTGRKKDGLFSHCLAIPSSRTGLYDAMTLRRFVKLPQAFHAISRARRRFTNATLAPTCRHIYFFAFITLSLDDWPAMMLPFSPKCLQHGSIMPALVVISLTCFARRFRRFSITGPRYFDTEAVSAFLA